jgi:hypothetical protein
MAKQKEQSHDTEIADPGSKKKSPVKKILILVVLVGLIAGGGFFALKFILGKRPASLEKSTLPPEVLTFVFTRLPDLYASLVAINDEALMTEKEIARITKIGDTYPDQKIIADGQNKIWESSLLTLTKGFESLEKEIQVIYVTYQVNPDSGQKMLDDKKDALKQTADTLVTTSKILTDKLRASQPAKNIFERTRDKLLKK